jgi:hypothetical protein
VSLCCGASEYTWVQLMNDIILYALLESSTPRAIGPVLSDTDGYHTVSLKQRWLETVTACKRGGALEHFPSGVGSDELVFFGDASSCLPGAVCECSVGIVELQRCEVVVW